MQFVFGNLSTCVQGMEHRGSFLEAPLRSQPARAVRQTQYGQDQDNGRDGDDREHHTPVTTVTESRIREEGSEDADSDHELIARDDLAARILIGHFSQV